MQKPTLEVADIFRLYADEYIRKYNPPKDHLKVIRSIINCRTAALGGHMEECDAGCGFERPAYNSCRDRHCPKCQFQRTVAWIEKRYEELLPVRYFHVVFTIPDKQLIPIILPNKALIYNLLLKAAAETLIELAHDPKWLGAEIGFTCILHTWTQRLAFHPHVHAIVPAGGISNNQWITLNNPDFFIPFSVLAKKFAGKFLALLKALNSSGKLSFFQTHANLQNPQEFNYFCQPLYDLKWITYAKPCFVGPESVIRYLGNYIHKIAISNHRLLKLEFDTVFFTYRDRSDNNKQKETSLSALDFMKMFLQHTLPNRFVKIRSYGLLANRSKKQNLKKARRLLRKASKIFKPILSDDLKKMITSISDKTCPKCGKGHLIKTTLILPIRGP